MARFTYPYKHVPIHPSKHPAKQTLSPTWHWCRLAATRLPELNTAICTGPPETRPAGFLREVQITPAENPNSDGLSRINIF